MRVCVCVRAELRADGCILLSGKLNLIVSFKQSVLLLSSLTATPPLYSFDSFFSPFLLDENMMFVGTLTITREFHCNREAEELSLNIFSLD